MRAGFAGRSIFPPGLKLCQVVQHQTVERVLERIAGAVLAL